MEKNQMVDTMKKLILANPYAAHLGLEFLEFSCERAVGRIPYAAHLCNPYHTMHGGVLYSLADIVAGCAACLGGHAVSTIEGSLSYVRPAHKTTYVTCLAEQVRLGNNIAVYRVTCSNDKGEVLETGTFHFFITQTTLEELYEHVSSE